MLQKVFSCLFVCLVVSCQSDYSVLKNEIQQLQQENQTLRKQVEEMTYLKEHTAVPIAHTELKELSSKINGQRYQIKIKLPRDYQKTKATYPVLYVTDAETNFGGVCYIVQRLMKDKLIPPMIVVGIAYGTDYRNFYRLRSRDLTPVEDKDLRMGSQVDPTGGAPLFCKFLAEELFPYIAENYRIKANDRTLYGHSYGGLFGAYVLLNQPDLFNRYLVLAPSLWYKQQLMLDQVKNVNPTFKQTRLYMASGELEGRIDDLQEAFILQLRKRNFTGLSIKAEIMENETHRTIFGSGFTNGMRYLFREEI